MATNVIKINTERIKKEVTLTVKVIESPRFKFRKWLALKLLRLLTLVLGCNLKIDE